MSVGEFWELNSSWKQQSDAFKDERVKEWKVILGKYYCKIYCYDVAKYTRPKELKNMITDSPGMWFISYIVVVMISF